MEKGRTLNGMRIFWKLLTNNFGWKLASLGISYLLWLTLVAQPEMSTVKTLPVLYKNLPQGAALATGTPEAVHVELRGTQTALSGSNLADAMLTLDLDGVPPNTPHTFEIAGAHLKLPQGVQFVRADPPQLSVRLTLLPAKPDNLSKR